MSKAEWIERFVKHMVGKSHEKQRGYAEQAAEQYYLDEENYGRAPEDCADEDMSYWQE